MKKPDDRIIKLWTPTVLWAVVIFLLSCISSVPDSVGDLPYFDKIFHLFEFSIFGFFLYRSLRGTFEDVKYTKLVWWTVGVGVAYAASDEFHQFFVPNRHLDIKDWLVDGLGCFVGALIFINRKRLLKKWRKLRYRN